MAVRGSGGRFGPATATNRSLVSNNAFKSASRFSYPKHQAGPRSEERLPISRMRHPMPHSAVPAGQALRVSPWMDPHVDAVVFDG